MKVTVIQFKPTEEIKAYEGLTKLIKGIKKFRNDLSDSRVDQDTLESFLTGMRATTEYFESFLKDEPEQEES